MVEFRASSTIGRLLFESHIPLRQISPVASFLIVELKTWASIRFRIELFVSTRVRYRKVERSLFLFPQFSRASKQLTRKMDKQKVICDGNTEQNVEPEPSDATKDNDINHRAEDCPQASITREVTSGSDEEAAERRRAEISRLIKLKFKEDKKKFLERAEIEVPLVFKELPEGVKISKSLMFRRHQEKS